MSKKKVGEIWFDHAGNECFFRENGTISCRTVNEKPSMAVQSEKDSCDLNKIVDRFLRTGLMTNVRSDSPLYGDFSMVSDYHTAVLRSQEAMEDFMTLPASIRARFSNDPQELISFLSDVNNRSEAIKLGLVNAPQVDQVPLGASPPSAPPAEGAGG